MFKNSKVVAQPTTWENGAKQYINMQTFKNMIKTFQEHRGAYGGDRHFKNKMENVMVHTVWGTVWGTCNLKVLIRKLF